MESWLPVAILAVGVLFFFFLGAALPVLRFTLFESEPVQTAAPLDLLAKELSAELGLRPLRRGDAHLVVALTTPVTGLSFPMHPVHSRELEFCLLNSRIVVQARVRRPFSGDAPPYVSSDRLRDLVDRVARGEPAPPTTP